MMKVSEDRKQSLFRAAKDYLQSGNRIAALAHFDRVIDFEYRLTDAYFLRGRTRYELGDFVGAIHDFKLLLKIDPQNSGAFNNMANARVALGDYEGARDDYNFAVEYSGGDNALIYCNRGLNWLNLGMYVNAFEDFTKAIKIDSQYSRAYYFRGNIEALHFNFKNALRDFDRAVELDPTFANGYMKRGNVFLYFGDIEYGNSDMTYGAEFLSYAFWHEDKNNGLFRDYPFYYDRALDDFSRAVDLNPYHAEAYIARATIRLRMAAYYGIGTGANDLHLKAREDALKAIEVSEGDFGFYALACAEARLGEISIAMQHLDHALLIGEKSYDHVFKDRNWEGLLDNPQLSRIIQSHSQSELLDEHPFFDMMDNIYPEGHETFEKPFDDTFHQDVNLTKQERDFLGYLRRLSEGEQSPELSNDELFSENDNIGEVFASLYDYSAGDFNGIYFETYKDFTEYVHAMLYSEEERGDVIYITDMWIELLRLQGRLSDSEYELYFQMGPVPEILTYIDELVKKRPMITNNSDGDSDDVPF